MRKLIGLVVFLAVLAGVLSIVDVVVRQGVESAVANRLESKFPGSTATVKISSFPFLGRLAASGTVRSLQAEVTGVSDGSLHFARIDLRLVDLKLDRGKLVHHNVRPLSVAHGQVVAVMSQASLDTVAHLPLTLGRGTVSIVGVRIPLHLRIGHGALVILPGGTLPALRVSIPKLDILPCVANARIVPGALQVSCSFTGLPRLLSGTTYHF